MNESGGKNHLKMPEDQKKRDNIFNNSEIIDQSAFTTAKKIVVDDVDASRSSDISSNMGNIAKNVRRRSKSNWGSQ
jgi:hypothetical protein